MSNYYQSCLAKTYILLSFLNSLAIIFTFGYQVLLIKHSYFQFSELMCVGLIYFSILSSYFKRRLKYRMNSYYTMFILNSDSKLKRGIHSRTRCKIYTAIYLLKYGLQNTELHPQYINKNLQIQVSSLLQICVVEESCIYTVTSCLYLNILSFSYKYKLPPNERTSVSCNQSS